MLKRLINPTRRFKTQPTASAKIKGLEVMRMIRKKQCVMLESGAVGEVRFVNRLFRLAARKVQMDGASCASRLANPTEPSLI